ncbi:hypothetical protein C8Q74DRAFT_124505 [Fomes fomentarius]|nr:hypothetical protein C8Q74DRAFT_124505 [Fomes fomentarius]
MFALFSIFIFSIVAFGVVTYGSLCQVNELAIAVALDMHLSDLAAAIADAAREHVPPLCEPFLPGCCARAVWHLFRTAMLYLVPDSPYSWRVYRCTRAIITFFIHLEAHAD